MPAGAGGAQGALGEGAQIWRGGNVTEFELRYFIHFECKIQTILRLPDILITVRSVAPLWLKWA